MPQDLPRMGGTFGLPRYCAVIVNKEKLRARIADLTREELKTLSKMIGGKLSRRTLSEEDQEKLQAARQLHKAEN